MIDNSVAIKANRGGKVLPGPLDELRILKGVGLIASRKGRAKGFYGKEKETVMVGNYWSADRSRHIVTFEWGVGGACELRTSPQVLIGVKITKATMKCVRTRFGRGSRND